MAPDLYYYWGTATKTSFYYHKISHNDQWDGKPRYKHIQATACHVFTKILKAHIVEMANTSIDNAEKPRYLCAEENPILYPILHVAQFLIDQRH